MTLRDRGLDLLLLATAVREPWEGGVPVVNRLLLEASNAAGLRTTAVSLIDRCSHDDGAQGRLVGCAGGRARYVINAWRAARSRPRLVLATHVQVAPVARAVTRGSVAVFLHGVECWRSLPQLTAWGVRGARFVLCNSRHTLATFRACNPALAGIPGEVCHLPARELPTTSDAVSQREPRAIIVGRLWGRGLEKGQSSLISIWPRVQAQVPGAELWIAGDGEGRTALEMQAVAVGMGDSIRFLGRVTDAELDRAYRSCRVFVMPSKGEGFGLVFAEAMARGLPCIGSRFDAGAEVIEDGNTGLVVDPDDPAAIEAAVVRLLKDDEGSRTMGEAARRRAETMFSVERFRDSLLEALARHGVVARAS